MTRQVRRVGAVVLALFGALFINLNVIQVLRADAYADDPRNTRTLQEAYAIRRGSILLADGATEIARAVDTGEQLRFRRTYDQAELYAHVTGAFSVQFGRSELERQFDEVLRGDEDPFGSFADLVAGREQVGETIVTTIEPAVQAAARDALGQRRGAVVALDPSTGEILALWSYPSYDPNQLSGGGSDAIVAARTALEADPAQPLLNRALRGFYPPGSTFKVVTAAAALEAGTDAQATFEDPVSTDLPQTDAEIGNFGGGRCNGGQPITLAEALQVSCNTTFAQLGLDLGPGPLAERATAFGFDSDLGGQLAALQPSRFPPPGDLDPPATAQSAIGQRDVRATPLQMAVVAGAVGEGGTLRAPRLVSRIEDFSGVVRRTFEPAVIGQALSVGSARALTEMMVAVVEDGTAVRAGIDGVAVAGKTGTAQTGVAGGAPTVWFTGFAPAEDPTVAVAVVLEDGGDVGDEATGGQVAAPIARTVIAAALQQQQQQR